MKFDKDKITKLSSEIFDALTRLKELSELSKEDFLINPHLVASAKYFLIVAIEACLDMCYHVISKNKFRVPEDYADTFRVMWEVGLFSEEFVEKLVEMAKFRNRLVHIYWDVDDEVVYEVLQEDIQDIEEFIEKFTKALT
ncbi:MAG: DUF86 domain-containing protein [Methanophagales archaeon]|nr:DUF86 domain-containing protein [Methanophagales archaeon]